MESAAPPLVGFNNNVRYRGMRFHIQTEDSGVSKPHIITHLFADGGYVIKSVRTDYSEYVDRPDRPTLIQRLMREQHRAMALDLRDGRLDETIDRLIQASTAPEAVESMPPEAEPSPVADAPDAEPESTRCSPQEVVPERQAAREEAPEPQAEARPEPKPQPQARPEPKPQARPEPKPQAAPAKASTKPERSRRSAPPKAKRSRGRPSAALPMKPNAESIFGTAPQESLDEVILSYVATAKNGPPTRGSK